MTGISKPLRRMSDSETIFHYHDGVRVERRTERRTEMSEVLFWLGEPLDKLSREELIEVIRELSKSLDEQRNAHRRDMDFLYGDLLTACPIKKATLPFRFFDALKGQQK